jgi:hypothetical protein
MNHFNILVRHRTCIGSYSSCRNYRNYRSYRSYRSYGSYESYRCLSVSTACVYIRDLRPTASSLQFNSICYIPVYCPCDSYEPGLLLAYTLLGTVLQIRIHSYTEILNLTLRTYAKEHTTDYIRILYTRISVYGRLQAFYGPKTIRNDFPGQHVNIYADYPQWDEGLG